MEPTILIGDRVLVNQLAYSHRSVHRGDIVVFRRPADENCGGAPVTDLIKRVIGLPGETISLSSSSYVVIDGKLLNETWLPDSAQGITFPGPAGPAYSLDKPYVIPRGDYFVMGDNRTDSCDSRYWGPIPKSLIVGKVEWLLRRPGLPNPHGSFTLSTVYGGVDHLGIVATGIPDRRSPVCPANGGLGGQMPTQSRALRPSPRARPKATVDLTRTRSSGPAGG